MRNLSDVIVSILKLIPETENGSDWHGEGNKTKYEFVRPEGFKYGGILLNDLDLTILANRKVKS